MSKATNKSFNFGAHTPCAVSHLHAARHFSLACCYRQLHADKTFAYTLSGYMLVLPVYLHAQGMHDYQFSILLEEKSSAVLVILQPLCVLTCLIVTL